jgi:hypothetical protein
MHSAADRAQQQAILLFIVSPIGLLGSIAFLGERPPNQNIPLGAMMAVVAVCAFGLAIWLWRKQSRLRKLDDSEAVDAEVL